MKPSFALHFTNDAAALLHRTSQGWMEVGRVALDDPGMEEALACLRGSALGLEPRGMTTKLVIPNSQIRYMTLPAAGADTVSRRAHIRRALEGQTPYDVDELVFDWWGHGPALQVAVVARETLAEAEAFATANRLNPLSFVAIPEAGQFGAEPWFGPTALAGSLLAPGEKVERDQDPVQIAGRLPRPELPAETASARLDDTLTGPADGPGLRPAAEIDTGEPAGALPLPEAVATGLSATESPETDALADSGPVRDTPPIGAATAKAVVSRSPAPGTPPAQTAAAAVTADRILDGAESSPPTVPGPQIAPATPAPPTDVTRTVADPRLARKTPSLPRPGGKPPAAQVPHRVRAEAAAPAQTGAVITASGLQVPRNRKPAIVAKPAATKGPDTGRARPTASPALTPVGNRPVQRVRPRFLGPILIGMLLLLLVAVAAWSSYLIASSGGEDESTIAVAAVEAPAPDAVATVPLAVSAPAAVEAPAPDTAATVPLAVLAPHIAATVPLTAPAPDAAATVPRTAAAPERTAKAKPAPTGARTDAALVTVIPAAADGLPGGQPGLAAFADGPAAGAGPRPAAALLAGPDAAVPDAKAVPVIWAAPVARPAMTVNDRRNPGAEPQDEILLAMIDPDLPTGDAVALALPGTATDPVPLPQAAPPPFLAMSRPDTDDRLVRVAEGTVTPGGVLVMAAPPPRPAVPVQPVTDAEAATPGTAGVAAADAVPVVYADPALQDARPRLRPADAVPPEMALPGDEAGLTGAAEGRLSSLKPRPRPPELVAAADAALQAETAAGQAAAASLVALSGEGAGSPLAVAVSRKPAARPAQDNAAIEAAVSVAAADASLVPETGTLAPAAPEPQPVLNADDPEAVESDEPEIASAAPSIPTRASVAKQATVKNSINLSKINLIGVYGNSSNRYAMVRQPNGRFIRVAVGDRVDGGRVAAISDRGLLYIKNGTSHSLEMPKG
jgi:hypothetical protein